MFAQSEAFLPINYVAAFLVLGDAIIAYFLLRQSRQIPAALVYVFSGSMLFIVSLVQIFLLCAAADTLWVSNFMSIPEVEGNYLILNMLLHVVVTAAGLGFMLWGSHIWGVNRAVKSVA